MVRQKLGPECALAFLEHKVANVYDAHLEFTRVSLISQLFLKCARTASRRSSFSRDCHGCHHSQFLLVLPIFRETELDYSDNNDLGFWMIYRWLQPSPSKICSAFGSADEARVCEIIIPFLSNKANAAEFIDNNCPSLQRLECSTDVINQLSRPQNLSVVDLCLFATFPFQSPETASNLWKIEVQNLTVDYMDVNDFVVTSKSGGLLSTIKSLGLMLSYSFCNWKHEFDHAQMLSLLELAPNLKVVSFDLSQVFVSEPAQVISLMVTLFDWVEDLYPRLNKVRFCGNIDLAVVSYFEFSKRESLYIEFYYKFADFLRLRDFEVNVATSFVDNSVILSGSRGSTDFLLSLIPYSSSDDTDMADDLSEYEENLSDEEEMQ